ncbi:autophagy-related protein 16-1 [Eucyclogobius newberryi]|uniref:autophagy-related protein 16-1 n=1 Tax=Eucyclogobius newberryi TaxID=166745 RepID=UPI003B597846
MLGWKSHVRSKLRLRDESEKDPFTGVFTCLHETQERLEFRNQILEEIHCKSLDKVGVEDGRQTKLVHLQLRESEHLAEKFSQTVSDLTAVLYLKEAEIQYWQSRVTHYHKEALRLAKGSNSLKSTLSEYEFTVECQSKELASLQKENERLKEALAQVQREKDQLLQRWMDRKSEEALRVNEYNNTQERWRRVLRHIKKHKEMDKPAVLEAMPRSAHTAHTENH